MLHLYIEPEAMSIRGAEAGSGRFHLALCFIR